MEIIEKPVVFLMCQMVALQEQINHVHQGNRVIRIVM